jgi:5-methylcytosine-specific restriction endonuclease McrA
MSASERRSNAIEETRRIVWDRAQGLCEVCHFPATRYGTPQLAHILPQSKKNLRKYGAQIIHHFENMRLTCCLKCNAAVSLSNSPIAEAEHVAKIQKSIEEGS